MISDLVDTMVHKRGFHVAVFPGPQDPCQVVGCTRAAERAWSRVT